MMAPSKIRRIGVVALLCLGIAVGAGCKKQRASLNLKKLKDIISEADANQADTFDKKEFDDVKKLVDAAQNAYNGEQFAPAYDQSRGAIQAAETMLENVKKARAAFLQTQAADDIKIAQDNNGQQQDPQRYQAILQANDKGKQRYTKSDWDGAIQSFLQVVSGVDELLAPIKLQAEQRLTEIKVSVKTMETEGVRQHAVQLGLDVDELVKTVEDLIQNKRQYVTAQTVMSRTEQAVAAAIEEAKRVRSLILINEIETDLGVALQYGAEVFFRQRIEQDAEAYTNILSAYEDRKYDNALQAAAILKPRAADLRYETRKRSAETKAKSVQDMIAKLEEGGAREYLPGSVEILDQMLKDAQTQIATGEEKGFDQAEQIAEAASEEQQKILADFNELANKAISESAKELDIATEVFRATDRIFDLAVPAESANDLERQLETNKQAMKAEIGALLDAARTTLGTAQLKRDSQQYRDSILLAEDIKKTAKIIQDETYRVAAHNSLLEIESQVTHYSAEGEQYAPKELAEARRLLGETRALIETGESKKAVDEAALAKAQLDVLKQDLSARGAQGIVEAQKALAEALDHKALQYAADQTAQAKKDLEDAIAARNLFDYRQVIERTRDAKALAEAARAAADREAAATQIESADARFQRAAQAYGALFSPRNYKDAGDKLSAARQMFAGEKYVEARQLAVEAADLADSAAFERVIDAEQQIATAKRDEAWRYASRKMADAINAAKDARASAGIPRGRGSGA
ncbi:MAG: hypothetical protein NTW86_13520 [Candidatus Sumerlaeota bacterium]|nr:hypothetical protein [Candidatus Sumerlaeota bacterium]